MNLALTPELERLIESRISSGQFQTAEEVIAAAVLALDREERAVETMEFEAGELDHLLAEGEADIHRGATLDGDQAALERRARREQRSRARAS